MGGVLAQHGRTPLLHKWHPWRLKGRAIEKSDSLWEDAKQTAYGKMQKTDSLWEEVKNQTRYGRAKNRPGAMGGRKAGPAVRASFGPPIACLVFSLSS